MKTRSSKTKGKRLQNKIRLALAEFFKQFGFSDSDFIGVPAGVPGTDVVLSPKVQAIWNYDIEAKNQERLNIWDAILQSRKRLKDNQNSIIVFSRNREQTYVTLELNDFLENYLQYYVKEKLLPNTGLPVLPPQIQKIPKPKENS